MNSIHTGQNSGFAAFGPAIYRGVFDVPPDHNDAHELLIPFDGEKRLGSMVTRMNLVTKEGLQQAIKISRESDLPLGVSLVMAGCLTRRDLYALIVAQSMLKDGLVSETHVVGAMLLIRKEQKLSLHAALSRSGCVVDQLAKSNKLGDLLVAAGVLDSIKLVRAISISHATMLPLGRVLVITGILSCPTVSTALSIQRAIRAKKMTRARGIEQLRFLTDRNNMLQTHPGTNVLKRGRDRLLLGELLIEAGLLSAMEVINAIEMALPHEKRIGEVLREFNWISNEHLDGALALQTLAEVKAITRQKAVRALRLIHSAGKTLSAALEDVLSSPKRRKMAMQNSSSTRPSLSRLVQEAQGYFVHGSIDADEAIILVEYCERKNVSIKTAFRELGWTVVTPVSAKAS